MSEPIRRLNAKGFGQFQAYLKELRDGKTVDVPRLLLTDVETSEPFSPQRLLEQGTFETRMEAARYLSRVFEGLHGLEEDVGLWSWLSLFYFDQVCPVGPDGTRSPGREYRHILEPEYRYGHRHLLAGPFVVFNLHGELGRLLLCTKLHQENRFHHELASRQSFISNPAIIQAASALYLDEKTGRPKRGSPDPRGGPGTLPRFIDVVQQLDVNYDLYSMRPEAILTLLPPEFDPWKRRKWPLRWRRGIKKGVT